MDKPNWFGRFLLATLLTGFSAQAQTNIWGAQENLFRNPASMEAPTELGWRHEEVLNLNLSFTSSQDVVGQTDGSSQTYGTNSRASLNHFSHSDEWRNDLFLRESTTRTPSVPRFVKSEDELKLGSIYLFYLPHNPNIGPYARGEASAPVFKGEDVHPDVKNYRVKHLDGSSQTFQQTSTRLTDGFRPFTTREALGFFFRPVYEDRLHLELRIGLAGQQIKARGSYVVKGAATDGYYDIQELNDVSQAGLEAGLSLKGKIDDRSTYEVGADSLTPFVNNKPAGDSRNAWQLTNFEGYIKLNSKITDWASFGYDYKVKIEPQLITRAQQIHMLVIGLNYPTKAGAL